MSLNIIDLIKGQLGPALVSQSATQLGESESGVSKAISGFLPVVLGGLAENSKNPTILDSIVGAGSNGMLGNLLNGSNNNSAISSVLSSIFGGQQDGVINSVSNYAGINTSSASFLLNMVIGAVIGSVGKYAVDNNLDKSGISNLLENQKSLVPSLLPAGLSLGALGLGTSQIFGGDKAVVSSTETPHTERVVVTEEPKNVEVNRAGATHIKVEENKGGSIWKWLLPLLLLLLLGFFAWKQCNKKETTTTTTTETTTIVEDTVVVLPNVDTTKKIKDIDVNGNKIRGYEGGFENQLVDFLNAGTYATATEETLKTVWYSFDNVNFEMASATQLLPGSEEQLRNLSVILKAFPDAKIKIGGYTDNVGNAAVNKKLSQDRADFLKAELTKLGVGNQIVSAEGYGSEFATVPATATDEERAIDRKMAIRFTK